MPESYLTATTEDGVAVITMARAPVNALDRDFVGRLAGTLERCASDPSSRVVIIASGLPKVFSGGADLREMNKLGESGWGTFIEMGQRLMDQLEALPKPVIAAVQGACVGGGCELAMACDLRVAGQSATFGQPEVNLGVLPGWGGSQRLPRLIGKTRAMELLMTGETVSAETALDLGLVNRVVTDDQVLPAAKDLAKALAARSSTALAAIKRAVHDGLDSKMADGLETEARQYQKAAESADAREGISAFLEKRPPRFAGD